MSDASDNPLFAKVGRRLRILIWCNYDARNAATMCDHVNAFLRYSENEVYVYSGLGDLPGGFELDEFDAIIVHYSIALALDSYASQAAKWKLRRCNSLKMLFIQDEYRFVNHTIDAIKYCGIDVIFTCVPDKDVKRVYGPLIERGVSTYNVLTGYVPPWLTYYEPMPLSERKYDVSYRGRSYPAWHGRAGREKIEIGKYFKKNAIKHGLKVDIDWSERGRLYGRAWLDLIRESRAVLAVESGCSVFDYDGSISTRVESYARLMKKRGIIPAFDREVKYEVLKERFFDGLEDQIDLSQISPRVFEAAALRTLLIMYEGEYSGVLKPWDHYLPLKKDHSNADEIVKILKDDDRVSEIVARCFSEVAIKPENQYQHFIKHIDQIISSEAAEREAYATAVPSFISAESFHVAHEFLRIENPHAQGQPRRLSQKIRVFGGRIKGLFTREKKKV